jgi:predicted DNA-binding protein (MmcQ/YjbR family)
VWGAQTRFRLQIEVSGRLAEPTIEFAHPTSCGRRGRRGHDWVNSPAVRRPRARPSGAGSLVARSGSSVTAWPGRLPQLASEDVTADSLRRWCLARPSAVEEFPFGAETSVFKVGGKMFALTALGARPLSVSLKCEPSLAEALRAEHSAVRPGYHLNKRHWITRRTRLSASTARSAGAPTWSGSSPTTAP